MAAAGVVIDLAIVVILLLVMFSVIAPILSRKSIAIVTRGQGCHDPWSQRHSLRENLFARVRTEAAIRYKVHALPQRGGEFTLQGADVEQ